MTKSRYGDFMTELAAEARIEGADAVEELDFVRARLRLAREMTEARKAKGGSQRLLATKTGLHQSEISDIECGQANPTFQTLQKLARSLDGRIGFLFTGSARAASKTTRQAKAPAADKQRRVAAHR